MKKIRVLVVDDSIFFRKFLVDKLSAYPEIEIVGTAMNATSANTAIMQLQPDVVTMDVEMPGMNGTDLLKHLMANTPVPVVLISSLNMSALDALSAGAVDFVKKPDVNMPNAVNRFVRDLVGKLTAASAVKLSPPRAASQIQPSQQVPPAATAPSTSAGARQAPAATRTAAPASGAVPLLSETPALKSHIIALGASTGGTEATLTVLKELPENTPGIVIVQHMPAGFTKMYADRLNGICPMRVREAKNGDMVEQGLVLIAPGGDLQMQVLRQGSAYIVKLAPGEKVSGHCPSVDFLFRSVAQTAGKSAVGIIMTGMGKDGAEGLLDMRRKGAFTIGQDETSSVVYGMPMVAYNIGAVAKQASCSNIPYVLKTYLNQL